ncbi:hypothetical protein G9A89_011813 [Geosiphon pyriformis]|nr:hypothetical protein G9A89_011813 [Geosiphon pyriformis]
MEDIVPEESSTIKLSKQSTKLWFQETTDKLSAVPISECSLLVNDSVVSDVHWSYGYDIICNNLLTVDMAHLSVYTDGSLCSLRTANMKAGAAVFFENINSGLGVRVSGLVSSTLTELQAIALALECCVGCGKSESLLVHPDFRNQYWIEHCHITNIICYKNLYVNWIKVWGHFDISGNECTDVLTKDAVLSTWHLPHLVNEWFLKAGGAVVLGNSRHFVHNIFQSIHCAHWEIGSGSQIMLDSLYTDVNWSMSSMVWHTNSHLAVGFTSKCTAGFCTYFMKALHCRLPVAVCKCLYNKCYPSVVCLFCGKVEVSDHVFCCLFDDAGCAYFGLFQSSLHILQMLSTCVSNVTVDMALCKGFVFNNWFHKFVSVVKDFKIAALEVVDFVHTFCLKFQKDIWLVYAKHWAFMDKNGLISHNGSISVLISGLSMLFLAGMIKLLDIAKAFGVGFGFYKRCLFFSDIRDLVFVHIGA